MVERERKKEKRKEMKASVPKRSLFSKQRQSVKVRK